MKDKEKFKEIDWEEHDNKQIEIPPLITVINKMENVYEEIEESFRLDLESIGVYNDALLVSAIHGDGMPDLYQRIHSMIP